MYITDVSIRRPVVAWVMSLILIIFGIFVFSELPVRELPDGIQPPVVQVQVNYKSAAASIIDQDVTQVMEDVIGGAEGIKNIDSKSENGRSTINIEFDTSIDLDNAANDIRERVSRVVDNLPSESDPPQKFFNESQIYDDILVNTDNENQNELNFNRVATNNRYPHQENLYSYSLTDNMQFLDVVVTQYD